MLGVPLDLSPVGVHEGLGVTQALAEKRLELVPGNQDRAVCVSLPFILLLAETDPIPKERYGKGNLVSSRSPSGSKIVLTLLTEVVAVHVRLFAVYVWGTGLQLLLGRLGDDRTWSGSGSRSSSL